ncbi:MAG: outer membrane beta-barrel protein [Bacteroidia bacterium]|nr:outer membrane beta-barrel protein [Bacteroidia bacterium]
MKKSVLFAAGMLLLPFAVIAQEEEAKLKISGSVDTYYKYDFSGNANIGTSFANEQNSISIGMLDLKLEKASGKASFMAELSFGPRSRGSVGPGPVVTVGSGERAVDITEYIPSLQNLYVSYAFTDKFSVTAGYMGTFVGYELIQPTGNFNYSTSYLFTNGPFQNAGVKAQYAFSDKISVMAGLFNPWNVYTADPSVGPTSIGGQLKISPVENWNIYLNAIGGAQNVNGTILDLTTSWQVTDDLLIGLNAARNSDGADTAAAFTGAAAYLNYALTSSVALGLRYEHFEATAGKGIFKDAQGTPLDAAVNAFTLSANIGAGDLTLVPELRLDAASMPVFLDADGSPVKSAFQALIAAVYAF